MKVCLVSSPGGHLYKTLLLRDWWGDYERFWVTDVNEGQGRALERERVYQAFFPENRNLFNLLKNLWLAVKVLWKERPEVIFSLGAGVAPPFFLVGKLLGMKLVFMETFITVPRSTMSGRLVYPLCDLFIVQNKKLLKTYNKAVYWGAVL